MNRLRSNPWAVLLVMNLGFFMILLDTTIVNIAIPSIIDALNASLDQILWVLNAYILVYAVLLITAGRLGDIYGPRNLFALGMLIFIVASALSGLAQSTDQLIASRAAQGVGGALLTPQTLAVLTYVFPPERRGAAFGIWGAVAGVAAVAGPTLGGFIVTTTSWNWIFFINIPIGAFALVATFLVVPDLRPGRRHRIDLVGVALASLGLFAIVFGLIEGEYYSWGTIWGFVTIPLVLGLGVGLLIVFFLWETRQAEPLVPLSLFRDRNYSLMNWVAAAVAFALLGLYLPLTIYLQSVLDLSALSAGLVLAPLALTSMVVAPFAGRLADRFGGKYILMGGLLLYAAGLGLVDWAATPTSSGTSFVPWLILAGFGQGCVFAPMTTVAMRDISPVVAGAASGVLNTTRQLGGVLGSSVVGALLQNQLAANLYSQAVSLAVELPPAVRQQFIQAFSNVAQTGFQVGPAQVGALPLPPNVPPQVAAEIERIAREVFANAFVDAMRPTLILPLGVLVVAAISCLAIINRRPTTEEAPVRGTAARPAVRWHPQQQQSPRQP